MGQKKRQRTKDLIKLGRAIILREEAINALEQHNFKKLVKAGIIVEDRSQKTDSNIISQGRADG